MPNFRIPSSGDIALRSATRLAIRPFDDTAGAQTLEFLMAPGLLIIGVASVSLAPRNQQMQLPGAVRPLPCVRAALTPVPPVNATAVAVEAGRYGAPNALRSGPDAGMNRLPRGRKVCIVLAVELRCRWGVRQRGVV